MSCALPETLVAADVCQGFDWNCPGQLQFADLQATNYSLGFYRVRRAKKLFPTSTSILILFSNMNFD